MAGFFEGLEGTNGTFTLPKGELGVALGATLGLAIGNDEGTEVGTIV